MKTVRLALVVAAAAFLAACGSKDTAPAATATAPAPADAAVVIAPAQGATLSEVQVRQVVEAAEAAARAFDDAAALATLSEDVRFTLQLPAAAGVPPQVMNRTEIAAAMAEQKKTIADRTYSSQIRALEMAPDAASGTVAVDMTNGYSFQGHKLVESGTQLYTVALREGQPRIVAMHANTTSLTVDGVKRF